MKRINKKSIIAVLTACLAFATILAVILTATLTGKAPTGGGIASGDNMADIALIADASASTDALKDGEVPSGYSVSATTTITTGAQFISAFATEAQSGVYVLANDIELAYTPPNDTTSGTPRLKSGITFDGQGHTITLSYSSPSRTGIGYFHSLDTFYMSYLFDYIAGTVKNLNIKFKGQTIDNQLRNTGDWGNIYAGIMCSRLESTGRIENASVTLNVKLTIYNVVRGSSTFNKAWCNMYFGAFAGQNHGTLKNCTTNVDSTTLVNIWPWEGSYCNNTAFFGGLVGIATSTSNMINCSFRNTRTTTSEFVFPDGGAESVGLAFGLGSGSVDGFIYYSNYDDVKTGVKNCSQVGLVSAQGSYTTIKNIYANRQISNYWVVGSTENLACVNIFTAADTNNLDMYFDKTNVSNIVFKLKDSYTANAIIWSVTHGKNGAADSTSTKEVGASASRCVSVAKYDGGVKRDAGTNITFGFGTLTTLNISNTNITYSNSDIDMKGNSAVSLASGTKNTNAFTLKYTKNNVVIDGLPHDAGTYSIQATPIVEGASAVYYDATARIVATAGTQGTLTINRYNLTMTVSGNYYTIQEKIYDGSSDHTAGVTGRLEGVNGEIVNFIIDEAFFMVGGAWSGDAHNYATADVSRAARMRIIHHMDSPNYTVNGLTADLTQPNTLMWTQENIGISPRNIDVDGSIFNVEDKIYDGTTTATATQVTTVGGISGQTIVLSNISATFNSQNVADANTVTITFRHSDTNYKINNVLANNDVTATTSKTISPKQISVTFGDNLVQSYRDRSAIDTVNCVVTDGLITGDTATVTGEVVDGIDFTKFGKYTLSAHVDTENYYSNDTAELTLIYFKSGANVGEWLIESIDDFNKINDNAYYLALNYVQSGDIDAHYSVVDSVKGDFSGSYSGGGFTIKNVVMIADGSNNGLFENVTGSISDLMVANVSINGYLNGATIGGITGNLAEGATLTNVAFVGDIYVYGNSNNVGGIVGTNSGTITSGAVVGDILVVGDNNVIGSAIGTNTSTGSMTGGVLFVPIEVKGTGNTAAIRAGVNDGTTISTAIRTIAKSVINNGVATGSGSSASALFTVVAYQSQTVQNLLNTYRNKMNIDFNTAKNEIEISNVNDLSLLREYRYLKFKLTADITMHIDSYAGFPTQIGGLNMNGFKIYTTDGKTLTELNIA